MTRGREAGEWVRRAARCRRAVQAAWMVGALLAALGCGSTEPRDATEVCEGFHDWLTSPYVLPCPTGAAYLVDQGNCSPPGNGHRGSARYGYDFLMPIGTPVTAARGGVVLLLEESHLEGEVAPSGKDNYLLILQDDGTVSLTATLRTWA